MERRRRGHGHPGLHAFVARIGQREVPAQDRWQHPRRDQGRRCARESALLRAQAHARRCRRGPDRPGQRQRRHQPEQPPDLQRHYSTTAATKIACWDQSLGTPGPVDIAITGSWQGKTIGLKGEDSPDGNHAKVGVSTQAGKPHCIFGDLNQQGVIVPTGTEACAHAQNARGGTFYVLEDPTLCESLTELLRGQSAPAAQ
jgi:hypothetical protein